MRRKQEPSNGGASKRPVSANMPDKKRASVSFSNPGATGVPQESPLRPPRAFSPANDGDGGNDSNGFANRAASSGQTKRRASTIATIHSVETLHTPPSATKVYIRVRPFNDREKASLQLPCLSTVRVESTAPTQLTLLDPAKEFRPMTTFAFERIFWSIRDGTKVGNFIPPKQALQEDVYKLVGRPILDNTLEGYNGCVFAYGQTGSGKTYTMMGNALSTTAEARVSYDDNAALISDSNPGSYRASQQPGQSKSRKKQSVSTSDPDFGLTVSAFVSHTGDEETNCEGIIPRLCRELFEELHNKREKDNSHSFRVEMDYYEIYNEKVLDLLNPVNSVDLRVRQISTSGPFIEGLARKQVTDEHEIFRWIHKGSQARHTAATKMNDRSSRSHAILTLNLVQMMLDDNDNSCRVTSKLNLVDLAGSERTSVSGVEGKHFKEATKINLSLTTLGRVIDCLADMATGKLPPSSHCPYRDSNLTWLLMDSLGGNSRTSMVATVSPHALNYDEMCQTIRYASRAKQIVNKAVINEDPMIRQIKMLTAEVERLRGQLAEQQHCDYSNDYVEELRERVRELERQVEADEDQIANLKKEIETLKSRGPLGSTPDKNRNGGTAPAPPSKTELTAHTVERLNKLHLMPPNKKQRDAAWSATELAELLKNLTARMEDDNEKYEALAKRTTIMVDNHSRTLREYTKAKEQKEREVLESIGAKLLELATTTSNNEIEEHKTKLLDHCRAETEEEHSRQLKDVEEAWKKRVDSALEQSKEEGRKEAAKAHAVEDQRHKAAMAEVQNENKKLAAQLEEVRAQAAAEVSKNRVKEEELQKKMQSTSAAAAKTVADAEKQIVQLKTQLESEQAAAEKTRASEGAQKKASEKQLADVRGELQTTKENVLHLKGEVAALKKENATLSSQTKESEKKAAQESKELETKLTDNTKKLSETSATVEQLKKDLSKQAEERKKVEREVEDLKVQLKQTETQLEKERTEKAAVQRDRATSENVASEEARRLQSKVDELQRKVEVLGEQAAKEKETQRRLVAMEEELVQEQKKHVEALGAKNDEYVRRIADLQKVVDKKLEDANEAQNSITKRATREKEDAATTISALKDELQTTRENSKKQTDSLRKQCEELTAQLEKERALASSSRVAQERESTQQLQALEEELRNEKEKHRKEVQAASQEHAARMASLEESAKKRDAEATSSHEKLATESAEEKQKLLASIADMKRDHQQQQDQKKAKIAELEKANAQLKKDLQEAQDRNKKTAAEATTTQRDISSKLDAATKQHQKLVEEHQKQLQQLRKDHEKELNEQNTARTAALRDAEKDRQKRENQLLLMIDDTRAESNKKVEEMKAKWHDLVMDDQAQYIKTMESAEAKSREYLQELHALVGQVREKYVEETVRRDADYSAKVETLNNQLSNQLNELRKKNQLKEDAALAEKARLEKSLSELTTENRELERKLSSQKTAHDKEMRELEEDASQEIAKLRSTLDKVNAQRENERRAAEAGMSEAGQTHTRELNSLRMQMQSMQGQFAQERLNLQSENNRLICKSFELEYRREQSRVWSLMQQDLLHRVFVTSSYSMQHGKEEHRRSIQKLAEIHTSEMRAKDKEIAEMQKANQTLRANLEFNTNMDALIVEEKPRQAHPAAPEPSTSQRPSLLGGIMSYWKGPSQDQSKSTSSPTPQIADVSNGSVAAPTEGGSIRLGRLPASRSLLGPTQQSMTPVRTNSPTIGSSSPLIRKSNPTASTPRSLTDSLNNASGLQAGATSSTPHTSRTGAIPLSSSLLRKSNSSSLIAPMRASGNGEVLAEPKSTSGVGNSNNGSPTVLSSGKRGLLLTPSGTNSPASHDNDRSQPTSSPLLRNSAKETTALGRTPLRK